MKSTFKIFLILGLVFTAPSFGKDYDDDNPDNNPYMWQATVPDDVPEKKVPSQKTKKDPKKKKVQQVTVKKEKKPEKCFIPVGKVQDNAKLDKIFNSLFQNSIGNMNMVSHRYIREAKDNKNCEKVQIYVLTTLLGQAPTAHPTEELCRDIQKKGQGKDNISTCSEYTIYPTREKALAAGKKDAKANVGYITKDRCLHVKTQTSFGVPTFQHYCQKGKDVVDIMDDQRLENFSDPIYAKAMATGVQYDGDIKTTLEIAKDFFFSGDLKLAKKKKAKSAKPKKAADNTKTTTSNETKGTTEVK